MNTTRTATLKSTLSTVHHKEYTPTQTKFTALALSTVLTLAMLLGIHSLAATDASQQQMAQVVQPRA